MLGVNERALEFAEGITPMAVNSGFTYRRAEFIRSYDTEHNDSYERGQILTFAADRNESAPAVVQAGAQHYRGSTFAKAPGIKLTL